MNPRKPSRSSQSYRPYRGKRHVSEGGRETSRQHKKPPLHVFPTTLWEYPSQHYGEEMQGDKNYTGATPSWVIWQLLMRYTREGDTVVDPMCGSGTTLDVAKDLDRRAYGFDLNPQRQDIQCADARQLPLPNGSVDFYFVDPPYSTHVEYSDDPSCIGKLDALEQGSPLDGLHRMNSYFEAMAGVFAEAHRVLRNGRYMACYVSDSYKKLGAGSPRRDFAPIGFELFALLRRQFRPVDMISVVRKNEKLQRGNWRKSAVEENFYLRGFNYCMIFRKQERTPKPKFEEATRKGRMPSRNTRSSSGGAGGVGGGGGSRGSRGGGGSGGGGRSSNRGSRNRRP